MITVDEMTNFFERLKIAYRPFFAKLSEKEILQTVSFWAVRFSNSDPEAFSRAVDEHIDSCQFMPTISEIVAGMKKYSVGVGRTCRALPDPAGRSYKGFPMLSDGMYEILPGGVRGNSTLIDSLSDLELAQIRYIENQDYANCCELDKILLECGA